jgi:hypothetical protein
MTTPLNAKVKVLNQ